MSPQPATAPTVLVTGASSGIGQATARLLAQAGHRVFGTSRQDRPDGHGVEMLRLDIRTAASVRRCVDEVMSRAGRIDVLVNNAGVMHEGFAEEAGPDGAQAVFDTNFFGAVRVTQAVLPHMRRRRSGRIINVGSLAAWVGEPGEGFYAASKAALARYTEALRHEVRHLGIHVSLVEPGVFSTGVLSAATTAAPAIADYDGPRESARGTLHRALENGADPRRVGILICRIARASRPGRRYGAGAESCWVPLLTTLLPQRLVDGLLRRSYGLPG